MPLGYDTNRLLCFDTETTGVDVYGDRIVTAFLGLMDKQGHWIKQRHWLLNPGVEIHPEAEKVHGISSEHAQQHGMNPVDAVYQMGQIIETECITNRVPLVVYNAPFDLTLIQSEQVRYRMQPIDFGRDVMVIDPLVIDKGRDMYRKGKRTLTATAPVYGVPVEENAHDAGADCLMAGRIALAILNHPQYASKPRQWWLDTQRVWKAEQNKSFRDYKRNVKGKTPADKVVHDFEPQWGWPTYD